MKKMITACLCAALVCTSGCDKTESSASDETPVTNDIFTFLTARLIVYAPSKPFE